MGILYLVATPVGNLEDISLRALRILKEVDLIACEDTRHTAKLLTHYGIRTHSQSYHKFNEESRAQQLVQMLREAKTLRLSAIQGRRWSLIPDTNWSPHVAGRASGLSRYPVPRPRLPPSSRRVCPQKAFSSRASCRRRDRFENAGWKN